MIDTISEKLTTERHRLYAFLGIEESPTGTLKEKIFTALDYWLNKQSNHFWKYQELLRAFREQGNIKAINEIEAKYGIKGK